MSNDDCTQERTSERPLRINVGGQVFTTFPLTLTFRSSYFRVLLTDDGPWAPVDKDQIFVDRDPDMFVHVLTYLRTGLCPLYYTLATGFDYPLYRRLKEEAAYFGIDELIGSLNRQDYHKLASVEHRTCVLRENSCELGSEFHITSAETVVKHVTEYRCPRSIRGHVEKAFCGRLCHNQMDEATGGYFSVPVTETWAVLSKVILH